MPTLMVRYKTAEDGVDDVVRAVEAAFAEVNEQRPDGIRWIYWRRAGSNEFFALLELDDGVENPLLAHGRRQGAAIGGREMGGRRRPDGAAADSARLVQVRPRRFLWTSPTSATSSSPPSRSR